MISIAHERSQMEKHRQLLEKADRILESDEADLFMAIVNAVYDHVMKKESRRSQAGERGRKHLSDGKA